MVICVFMKSAYKIYHVFWFFPRVLHSFPMISPAPAGQISTKFDVEKYYENLSMKSKFG